MMRTKKARERGHEDQEWEQRRQNRQGDVARNSPAVVLRKSHKGVVENPKDKVHPSAASCRPGLNETPERASPLHSCTRAGPQFRSLSGVFVTPHWHSLFVPIIVRRFLQMIKARGRVRSGSSKLSTRRPQSWRPVVTRNGPGMETSDRSERYIWTFWRLTRSPGDKENNNKNANPTISRKRGDFLKAGMCPCAMAAPREMLRRRPSEKLFFF